MLMELNLAELTNGVVTYDTDFTIDVDVYQNVGIIDLKKLHVTGDISLNSVSM